jgi:glycosyltransferase involved in cell wall biosynthesis
MLMLKIHYFFLSALTFVGFGIIAFKYSTASKPLDLAMETATTSYEDEKEIVVIIPSFNNKEWYTQNLDTLWMQDYHNFRVIYIDDCSTDGTGTLVEQYILTHPHHFDIQLIKNEKRYGALANLYNAIHSCSDNAIIITLDGDDSLPHQNVLKTLNNAYKKPILMTYGQYVTSHRSTMGHSQDFPTHVIQQNLYRKYTRNYIWIVSHLRSFYAGLFKQIKKEDLMIDGDFFMVTWDRAMMLPMLEMAAGRYKFISDVMYVYNDENPINDYKVRLPLMLRYTNLIHDMPPYQPLPPHMHFSSC